MSVDFQTTLFDEPAAGHVTVGSLDGEVQRHELDRGAWVDVRPGWLRGADELFARLVRDVPWYAERRQMYDRVVDVPRLLCFYGEHDELPDPALVEARDTLSRHYQPELGEPFVTAGLCYYRDGRDSVAWHGDTIGRSKLEDTMVAIVSLVAVKQPANRRAITQSTLVGLITLAALCASVRKARAPNRAPSAMVAAAVRSR